MRNFNKITLENGLRIITAPKPDSLTVTVLVLVEAGSKYETKEINGISHFLEHMCFKGTKKRPRSIDINSEFDGIGAVNNAFTGHEYTGYYAVAEPRHFDKILDLVSDIYLNSVLPEKEIDKERGVIIEEINMYEDLLKRKVQELFTGLLYGDQPAGWDIAGRKEVIQKLSRNDFLKYRDEHYLAQATIIAAAGNIPEQAVEKIKKIFGGVKIGDKIGKIKTIEKQKKPEVMTRFKKTSQAHLVLGVRAFDIFDERRHAVNVLADILGGSMSSRLFQKIREEMGAAYYVGVDADLYTDHGYLAAFAGVDNKKIIEVIEAILEEFKKMAVQKVAEKELQKAKDHLTGTMMISLETADALANFYGGQELMTKEILTPKELAVKIQAVKAEEIQAVAKDIFQNNKLNLAIIGPFKDKERFEKILTLR
ncbi:MAG: pitrilysin family protein [Patescibacteria group bacterium]|mgnify:FL=1